MPMNIPLTKLNTKMNDKWINTKYNETAPNIYNAILCEFCLAISLDLPSTEWIQNDDMKYLYLILM